MIILGILASLAAIGLLCWLLFTLAVFALPAFVGVTAGAWAHGTGAGIPGAVLVGAGRRRPHASGRSPADHLRPPDVAEADRGHCLRRAGGRCWLPRHAWHCEAPHAVRGMADHLLRHWRDRGGHHRLYTGRRNGGGPGSVRPGPRASLIVVIAIARATSDGRRPPLPSQAVAIDAWSADQRGTRRSGPRCSGCGRQGTSWLRHRTSGVAIS